MTSSGARHSGTRPSGAGQFTRQNALQMSSGVSRRHVLQMALGAGVGGPLLAACGRDEPEEPNEPGGDPSTPPADDAVELSGEVSVALPMPTPDSEDFYTEAFAKFEADNPGVSVNFLPFPDRQFGEAIQSLFQGGDQPDVYRMIKPPARMPASLGKGWIQPLDEYEAITDMLARDYGESALDPSTSGLYFGEDLYGVPGLSTNQAQTTLLFNTEVLDQYGISGPPETWSELRDTAAKITSDSGGDVSGIAFVQDAQMLTNIEVRPLMVTAGPVRQQIAGIIIDKQTGKAAASHPAVVETVALLRGLVEDGSVLAGWQNMDPTAFWQAWVAGKAAMAPMQAWWAEEILKIDPQAPMSLAAIPVPDSGRKGYTAVANDWIPTWGMAKAAQNTAAAAALIAYLGSLEHQRDFYENIKQPTPLALEYEDVLTDSAKQILTLGQETSRRGPNLGARTSDARALTSAIQAALPEPGFNEIVFSAVADGDDYADAAGTFDDALQTVIDDEIAKAIADGADFDENVLAFPDWDPLEDYTPSA